MKTRFQAFAFKWVNLHGYIEALRMVGHALIRLRSFEPAGRCLELCLALACSIGDPSLVGMAHFHHVILHWSKHIQG